MSRMMLRTRYAMSGVNVAYGATLCAVPLRCIVMGTRRTDPGYPPLAPSALGPTPYALRPMTYTLHP
eukprot:3745972-Rhodomonas_salina.1